MRLWIPTTPCLACGATLSRLEGALRRSDIYRLAHALVEQFIAGYSEAPLTITLALDHTDDAPYGQQELSCYNPHDHRHCYLPLRVFEAHSDALVTAILRPGRRPTGAENAMIMKRVLRLLRRHWPHTHLLLRGDAHFATPELMQLIVADGNADFVFGLAGNAVLLRQAEGLMKNARGHFALHQSLTAQGLGPTVDACGFSVTLSRRPDPGRKPSAWCSRPKCWRAVAKRLSKTISALSSPPCADPRPARSTSRTTVPAVR